MSNVTIDKLVLGFLADILYVKGVINLDELEGIYDIKTYQDLHPYTEKLLRGEFNAYKTGEHYTTLAK